MIAAYRVGDPAVNLGDQRPRRPRPGRRARRAAGSSMRHMRAGVTIEDPGADLDRRRRRDRRRRDDPARHHPARRAPASAPARVIGPMTTLIDSAHRRARHRPPLLPDRAARSRDEAHRRPVRLPAARRPHRRGRQGRHLRRDQELRDRRRRQGPAPLLHRRRRGGRGTPTSAPARSPPTTTAAANIAPRSARTCAPGLTRPSSLP